MSEHITHLAICDDAARLASRHPHVHPTFVDRLTNNRDAARLGAVTRSADRWTVALIVWAREQMARPAEAREPNAAEKLAIALGALTHRAADRLMKPILDHAHQREGDEGFVEATVHCDVLSFREVYGAGEGPHAGPFACAILGAPVDEAGRAFEEYFGVLWRRQLVEMHTFAPDRSDVHGWLDKLLYARQDFPMEMARYARIAAEWDPVKVKRYLEDTHFYDRGDRLIQLARSIQRGEQVDATAVAEAVGGTTDASSRYARALAKALTYQVAASRLYEGTIDSDEARRRFEVGVPELALAFSLT